MQEEISYSYDDIVKAMPHQEPFLFLQSVKIRGDGATGTYKISGDEDFLRGHFKDNPVFPGTLMLESLGQLCVFYLIMSRNPALEREVDPKKIFVTCTEMARCTRVCRPGDTFKISAKAVRLRHPVAIFTALMDVNGERAAYADRITFAFDYKS